MTDDPKPTVRVWDLPTRLFHWVLAAAVVGAITTAHIGGNAMVWHFRLGLLVLTLLGFRLVWGLVGGRWSRFASFIYGPATIVRYLKGQSRGEEQVDVGHNPLGAGSVFALLGLLCVQVATGLVADDEIANQGPLNRFVSAATAAQATGWHKDIGQWLLVLLIGLHVSAILFYRFRHDKDLVRPMLTGDKQGLPAGTPASADGWPQRLLALLVLAASMAFAGWIWSKGA